MTLTHTAKAASPRNDNHKTVPDRLPVKEKIFQVQHDNNLITDKTGPELELFFHELKDKESRGKIAFDYFFASIGLILLCILYLPIALLVKLSSSGTVIQKFEVSGKSGHPFLLYAFRVTPTMQQKDSERTWIGKFLIQTGLYKLPAVINIFNGTMSAVGPMPYTTEESSYWNVVFDDYYKRSAVKPGIVPIAGLNKKSRNKRAVEQQLYKEFKYIIAPKFKNDMRVLFRNF